MHRFAGHFYDPDFRMVHPQEYMRVQSPVHGQLPPFAAHPRTTLKVYGEPVVQARRV